MHFENENTLVVHKFQEGLLRVDLSNIREAEERGHETSYVNRPTAQELMSVFVKAFTNVRESMSLIRYEYLKAEKAIEERRGVIILEVIPEEAIRRNVATKASPTGSEDFRNAVISADKEIRHLIDLSISLKAAHEFLSAKAKSFEMSYQQVKKIYSNDELEDHGLRSDNTTDTNTDSIGLSRY